MGIHNSIPQALPHELPRPALLELLEQTDTPLIACLAPSGYGKSVLLAQYARSSKRRTRWLALNQELQQPQALGQAILEALKAPSFEASSSQALSADHLLLQIPRTLSALKKTDLVLDRLELLSPESGLWLRRLLEDWPAGHRVLIAGFDHVNLPVTQWQLLKRLSVVGAAQLAFGLEETQDLLGLHHNPSTAHEVHHLLEGWPALTALVAAGATPGLDPEVLIEELIGQLPSELQTRLAQAAVLETWSLEQAAALGLDLPRGWIGQLLRSGLPITPLGQQCHRPHPMLLRVLEKRLLEDPPEHQRLHRQAGELALGEQRLFEAFEHFLICEAWPETLRLARRLNDRLIAGWDFHTALRTLERIPRKQLEEDLLCDLGRLLIHSNRSLQGQALLERLIKRPALRAKAASGLAYLAGMRGQFDKMLGLIRLASRNRPSAQLKDQILTSKVWCLFELGLQHQALRLARKQLGKAQVRHDAHLKLDMMQNIFYISLYTQPEACAVLAQQIFELIEPTGVAAGNLDFMTNLAYWQIDQDHLHEAEQTIMQALKVARQTRSSREVLLLHAQANIHMIRAEYGQAASSYQTALQACHGRATESLAQAIRYRQAELGHRSQNLGLLKHSLGRARQAPSSQAAQVNYLQALTEGMAALQDWLGERPAPNVAKTHLEQALHAARLPRERAKAMLYLAEWQRQQGQAKRHSVKQALAELDRVGNDTLLKHEAHGLDALYAHCIKRRWWPERFMPHRLGRPQTPAQTLKIGSFGQTQVWLENQALKLGLTRCNELLVYLALHGPKRLEEIAEALWDQDGKIHLSYTRVLLKRLRNDLGNHAFDPLPFESKRYCIHPNLRIELDCQQLEQAATTTDPARLKEILPVYQGTFLPEADSQWVLEQRARSLEQALELCLRLAKLQNNPRQALAYCEWALRLDELHEPAHQMFLELAESLGDKQAIRQRQQRFVQALKNPTWTLG